MACASVPKFSSGEYNLKYSSRRGICRTQADAHANLARPSVSGWQHMQSHQLSSRMECLFVTDEFFKFTKFLRVHPHQSSPVPVQHVAPQRLTKGNVVILLVSVPGQSVRALLRHVCPLTGPQSTGQAPARHLDLFLR